ncbi:MAG: HlyC/CorC family transporter [Deltaproteobacteria bacterium]|nr:HlyC/CorC family transporter [Deltaproteobacteria bacterium]
MSNDQEDKGELSFFKRIKALFKKPSMDSKQEIREIIDQVEEKGFIDEDLGDMIHNIIVLKDTAVHEIMVPKVDMVVLESSASIDDLADAIIKNGHSRIPIYDKSPDNIIGVVYAKDLLKYWRSSPDKINIKDFMRPPYFVPEGKRIKELLNEFKRKSSHIAIVIDEYGNVDGLLTIADIIEEIIGDLPNEDNNGQQPVIDQGGGVFLVDSKLPIDEFCETFSVEIPKGNYDTIGGFITYKLERIPKFGETLEYQGLLIKVASADKKRILRLVVQTAARQVD